MNQFVVPQFIDTEARIIGPVTVRQFVIVLVGIFSIVVAYKLADTALFIIEALIIALIVFAFGFLKVNGRPFHHFLINIIETIKKPTVRVWRSLSDKEYGKDVGISKLVPREDESSKAPLDRTRLKELSLIVDTGGLFKR